MALFRYPRNDFDDPDKLLGLLGSFWATTYTGNSFLQDIVSVTGQMAQQSHRQLMELIATVSRFDVPVFHQDNWYALTVKESELNTSSKLAETYDTPATSDYKTTTSLNYGDLSDQDFYAVEAPTNLHDVKVIFNRLADPSIEWVQGIDYWLQDGIITVREDPFENSLIPKRELLDLEGNITDRELTLWLYRGQWDWQTVYQQFGYALRLKLQSSEGYKQFLNAIFDAYVEGTSVRTQQSALAAAFGIPMVVEAEETVETISSDGERLNIITDQNVYQFPLGTTSLVSEGDVLQAGDPLTDLLQVFEFNRGKSIEASDISALTIGPGVLAWGFWGELTFENMETPLVVEENVDGYTKVSWEVSGFPFDVEKFWEDIHAKGVASGETLAMLLDVRENPSGQPTAASLPSTVNPLQFLADNLLRNNAYAVKVKPGSSLMNQLAFVPVEQLRKIQLPHTLMLLIVELVYADLPVIMENPGTELSPGYEESAGGFPCMTISETLDATTFVTERVRTTNIGGRCI